MTAVRPECGAVAGYRLHLRTGTPTCPACRAVHAADTARLSRGLPARVLAGPGVVERQQRGLVDAAPTRVVLRELALDGYSLRLLAAVTGYSEETLSSVRRTNRRYVTEDLAAAVIGAQVRLDEQGPSAQAARHALRAGWDALPPVDVDEIAVARAVAGDPPAHLTIRERAEAVRVLHSRGYNDQQIARTVRITDRTVLRIRNRQGLPAVEQHPTWALAS